MKSIKGNKVVDINANEFEALKAKFNKVVVDIGAGDGRFVYKNAIANPDTLFIGVDPAPKQMDGYSKKAVRKKLENVLFVVGSFELLPSELVGCADKLYIILPWGSLLKAVAEPTDKDVESVKTLLKAQAEVEIIFGYDSTLEPSQTSRLELKEIDENKVSSKFVDGGFDLVSSEVISNFELREFESTWGKRISSTVHRKVFRLVFRLE